MRLGCRWWINAKVLAKLEVQARSLRDAHTFTTKSRRQLHHLKHKTWKNIMTCVDAFILWFCPSHRRTGARDVAASAQTPSQVPAL